MTESINTVNKKQVNPLVHGIEYDFLKSKEVEKVVDKRWLDPSELEITYGFSKSTQAKMRMVSNGSNIPFSKIGKYIRYDRIAIDKWLEEHQVGGN